MYKYWWKLKNVLPVLECYRKYLETTRLLHYSNNIKMLRYLEMLVTVSFHLLSWTTYKSRKNDFGSESMDKGKWINKSE